MSAIASERRWARETRLRTSARKVDGQRFGSCRCWRVRPFLLWLCADSGAVCFMNHPRRGRACGLLPAKRSHPNARQILGFEAGGGGQFNLCGVDVTRTRLVNPKSDATDPNRLVKDVASASPACAATGNLADDSFRTSKPVQFRPQVNSFEASGNPPQFCNGQAGARFVRWWHEIRITNYEKRLQFLHGRIHAFQPCWAGKPR